MNMRILDLARKDLSQILHDWKSGLFLLIMPLLFTLFFGFVMGSGSAAKTGIDPRLPVGVIDQDGGRLAASLETLLEESEVIRPVMLQASDLGRADRMVEEGEVAAVVIIPSGYTTQLLTDQPVVLDVLMKPGQPAGQEPALTVTVIQANGQPAQDEGISAGSGYAQASAGMMVQFSIFGLVTSAMVLVLERKSGTLH